MVAKGLLSSVDRVESLGRREGQVVGHRGKRHFLYQASTTHPCTVMEQVAPTCA